MTIPLIIFFAMYVCMLVFSKARVYAALGAAALFVILGHIYPLYFGFKGGKGIMTGATTVFMLDWEIGVIVLLVFVAVFVATRYVSLGSCISSIMYPILVYMFHSDDTYFMALSVIVAIVSVYKHKSNIVRLIKGTESKTYFGKR